MLPSVWQENKVPINSGISFVRSAQGLNTLFTISVNEVCSLKTVEKEMDENCCLYCFQGFFFLSSNALH